MSVLGNPLILGSATAPSSGYFTVTDTTDSAGGTIRTITPTEGTAVIQSSKSVTITSNTTTTISPDTGNTAMGSVVVTTNVEGGGGASEIEAGVQFIDYDGTVIETWPAAQVASKTALPANPTHTGLTAQGWNWTLNDVTENGTTIQGIKSYIAAYPDAVLTVGQMYVTSDGTNQIDVTITNDTLEPWLAIYAVASGASATINWGDNTTPDTITATSSGSQWIKHTYTSAGNYTIKITVTSGAYRFYASSSSAPWFSFTNAYRQSLQYGACIRAIRLGDMELSNNACASLFKLQYITIPSSLTVIGTYALYRCGELKSITLPPTITTINNYSFANCFQLKSVATPQKLTAINTGAFNVCIALRSVAIPSSVTTINGSAFSVCNSLQSAPIPPGVTTIGDSAFSSCYMLRPVTIPSGITSINNSAFSNACRTANTVIIPQGVTTINSSAFSSWYALQHLTIPSGVTSIGLGAFYQCWSLQSLVLPSAITSIGNTAFYCPYTLRTLAIPAKVETIGNDAFRYPSCLEELYFKPSTPPTLSNSTVFGGLSTDCTIYVPEGYLSDYTGNTNYPSSSTYTYAELPTFTVDDEVYFFEDDMTVADWVASKYNDSHYDSRISLDSVSDLWLVRTVNSIEKYIVANSGVDRVSASYTLVDGDEFETANS